MVDQVNEEIAESVENPVAEIFNSTGVELRHLVDLTDSLQVNLSELIGDDGKLTSHSIYGLQNVDLLKQSLAAIAEYLENLAEQTPDDWRLNNLKAAQAITLADLAERLKNCVLETVTETEPSGDVDLF